MYGNGSLIGGKVTTGRISCNGMWGLNDQSNSKRSSQWPSSLRELTLLSNVRSTTIPTNPIAGKTQGFLGLIWQTGFNTSGTPALVTSAGWTNLTTVTFTVGADGWRSSLSYKILTLAELGTTISPIAYLGGNNIQIALFGTNDNVDINSAVIGLNSTGQSTVYSAGPTDPAAASLFPASGTVTLTAAQFYGFPTPVSPSFVGTPYTILGSGDQQLWYNVTPSSTFVTPSVTVDLGSNTYSHLSAFRLVIT